MNRRLECTQNGLTDVYINNMKCYHQLTDSQLRSYGLVGDTHGTLLQIYNDFVGHVKSVDAATKLTQSQPNCQSKQAKRVLSAFDELLRLLVEYKWSNIK